MTLLTSRAAIKMAAALNRVGLSPVNRLVKRALAFSGKDQVTVAVDGLVLGGPVAAWRTLVEIGSSRYEQTERALFVDAIRPGMMVVDIGAHVGLYALLAARAVGADGRVIAFEPDRRTFRALEENIARNRIFNTLAINKAVGERIGEHEMFFAENANRSSMHRSSTIDRVVEVATVPTTTVDDTLRGRIADVVKMDCEGWEPSVFRGMERSLGEQSVVFMEFNPPALASGGNEPGEFGSWLLQRFAVIDVIDQATVYRAETLGETFANLRCTGFRAAQAEP